jgi:hypothetical protein
MSYNYCESNTSVNDGERGAIKKQRRQIGIGTKLLIQFLCALDRIRLRPNPPSLCPLAPACDAVLVSILRILKNFHDAILKGRVSFEMSSSFSTFCTVSTSRSNFLSVSMWRVKFLAFSSSSDWLIGLCGVPLK